jgi:hypothetical protein
MPSTFGEADLDVLRPERHQAPAHHLEGALMLLRVIAHDRQGIGRGHIPAGGKIRVGRSGGIRKATLISLTSEERRARPHMAGT